MPETMTEVEPDAPADSDLFYRFGECAGELTTAGLNTLSPAQRQLVDRAIQRGSAVVLITTLSPLATRGMIQLPGGEVLTLFEVRDGAPVPIH